MKEYYTYAYLREDGTPYYIGKGKGDRLLKRRKTDIKPPRDKSKILFLKQNLTEEEAFNHEKYIIYILGRKDLGTGILRNKTNGGEGPSGRLMTQKTINKIKNKLLNKKWSDRRKSNLKNAMYSDTIRKKHIMGIEKLHECEYKVTPPNSGEYITISTIPNLVKVLPLSRGSIHRLIYNEKSSVKGWKIERISETIRN